MMELLVTVVTPDIPAKLVIQDFLALMVMMVDQDQKETKEQRDHLELLDLL